MDSLLLGRSGRKTSRLGFGCSSIMGALGRRDSLRMLETAFDAGVRHFDVAPSYGFGEAEGCLGEFLANHPGQLTVTTKFGIAAEPAGGSRAVLRSVARPVLKLLPGLKARLRPPAGTTAPARVAFSATNALASVERSLKALRTERIDLLLLHEAEAGLLGDDELLRVLEDLRDGGKIGDFGTGSEAGRIPALIAERPGYCHVLQYEWSVLDRRVPWDGRFRIHHRALTHNFHTLHAALSDDSERRRAWSAQCGQDVGDAGTLASLMLKAALLCNPRSVVLFSSKQPQHIYRNVKAVQDEGNEEAALRLYEIIQQEPSLGGEMSSAGALATLRSTA